MYQLLILLLFVPFNVAKILITGGEEAKKNEFPWMVQLQHIAGDRIVYGCGGALINNRYVLTAAHCVKDPTNQLEAVRLGVHHTKSEVKCTSSGLCKGYPHIVGIEEAIVHESFDPDKNKLHSDIALLRLIQNITFTDKIRPIDLPTDPKLNATLTAIGWGCTAADEKQSNILLKVDLPLFENTKCRNQFAKKDRIIIGSQICAGGELGKDTCSGDSGGPLMQRRSDGKREVRGITSFGSGICGAGEPGVYTDVFAFLPWISKNQRP